MDQNNMYQQENIGVKPTEQAQTPYEQPAGQAQNPYTAPMQSQTAYQPPVISEDVSMGEWMWTIFLLCIPIVNIILLFVWAFGGSTNPSKANYCKAQLLWMLIFCCLSIVLLIMGIFVGITFANSLLHSI